MRPCHENGLPFGGGVRLVDVVAEPAFVVLGAGVAVFLHGPLAPDEIVGAGLVLELVGLHVLAVVAVLQRTAGADQRDAHAGFAHALGGPPAGRARSDDDRIVLLRPGQCLHAHSYRLAMDCRGLYSRQRDREGDRDEQRRAQRTIACGFRVSRRTRCVIFASAVAPYCSRSRPASARRSSRHERRRRTCTGGGSSGDTRRRCSDDHRGVGAPLPRSPRLRHARDS